MRVRSAHVAWRLALILGVVLCVTALAQDARQGSVVRDDIDPRRMTPTNASEFFDRGILWHFRDENDKAIVDLTEAIRLHPKYLKAFTQRGLIWTEKGAYDKAIADFTAALRLSPRDVGNLLNRAHARHQKGEHDKARMDFDEAVCLSTAFPLAFSTRGCFLYERGEYDQAIADFTEAIRLETFVTAYEDYYRRGVVWQAKGKYGKAIADFDQSLRMNPGCVRALEERAWILATCPDPKFRDVKKAVESASLACEHSEEKDAVCLATLAAAHAAAGNFARAVEVQEKANKLDEHQDERDEGFRRLNLYKKSKRYFENTS